MENKVIASCGICNAASLNIYEFIPGINKYVVVGLNKDIPRKHKLYTVEKGTFFMWGGRRYYLDEFTRL